MCILCVSRKISSYEQEEKVIKIDQHRYLPIIREEGRQNRSAQISAHEYWNKDISAPANPQKGMKRFRFDNYRKHLYNPTVTHRNNFVIFKTKM